MSQIEKNVTSGGKRVHKAGRVNAFNQTTAKCGGVAPHRLRSTDEAANCKACDAVDAPAASKAPKVSVAMESALRYWADPDAFPCYRGGNRATVAALVKRSLLAEPTGMAGHRVTETGRAYLAVAKTELAARIAKTA